MRFSTGSPWALGTLLAAALATASCNLLFNVDGGQPAASTSGSGATATSQGSGATTASGGSGGTGGTAGTGGTGGTGATTASGGTTGTAGTTGSAGSPACASPDGQATKWVSHPVGNYLDEATAVAQKPGGGDVVVAGYYKSDDFVVKSLPALPRSGADAQEDVFVAAYSPDTGAAKWAVGFTGPNTQRPTNAAVDPSGSSLVAGWFLGSFKVGDTTLTSDQQYSDNAADGFVLKVDPSGAPLWAKQFGGASTDMLYGVASDSKGNVIVAGISAVAADMGSPPEPMMVDYGCGARMLSKDASWVFLTKLDPDGKCLWDKQYVMDTRFGGIYSRTALAVTVDPSDNVILTGGFDGQADFGFAQVADAGGKDIFLLKLDPDGKGLWVQTYGDMNYQVANTIATDASGDIWIGGWYNGSVTLGDLPKQVDLTADNQNRKAFFAKLTVDPAKPTQPARPVFLHALSDVADLTATSVTTTPDGDAVFGVVTYPAKGTTGVEFGDKVQIPTEVNVDGNYYSDGFVVKYCKDGGLRWVRPIATPSREVVWGVATDATGHTLAVGSFDGVYDFKGMKSIMPYGVDPFVLGIGP